MKRLLWVLLSAQLGCSASSDVEPSAELQDTSRALGLGDRGTEVRAVYDYLARYGYFPNAELARSYPGFEPLVAQAPRDLSVFDERLAEAVRQFQSRTGHEATGSVDAATLAAMQPRGCAWPDGYSRPLVSHSEHDKFRVSTEVNSNLTTWSLESLPVGQSDATIAGLITEMLSRWSAVHKNTFRRVPAGQGQAKFTFTHVDGPVTDSNGDNTCDNGCRVAQTQPSTWTVEIDNQENWEYSGTPSTAVPWSSRKIDFRSVILHEFGHVLGLEHTSVMLDAIMFPSLVRGATKRNLGADDRLAIRSRFSSWVSVATPAPVTDINGSPLAIITNEFAGLGGFKIYRNNGTSWVSLPGAATRVTSDIRFRLWVVNSVGAIYYRPQADTDWVPVQGCASDIAISWQGLAWAVGCDGQLYVGNMNPGADDATLFAQKDAGWSPLGLVGAPAFVNVGAGNAGSNHAVTAIDVNGNAWGAQVTGGIQKLPLTHNILMADAAGSWDLATTWATAKSGQGVFAMNVQLPAGDVLGVSGWLGYGSQSAKRIGVDLTGRPYVVTSTGTLMTTVK